MQASDDDRLAVAFAEARFASVAVALLVDKLRKAGVIDDLVLGEISGMTHPSEDPDVPQAARQQLLALRAKLTGE